MEAWITSTCCACRRQFRLGAIRGERVGKIHEILGEVNIEDLSIPTSGGCHRTFTNQRPGNLVPRQGCLHQAYAIRASAAIPNLFTPVMQGQPHAVEAAAQPVADLCRWCRPRAT
ncbi:hypothetical protein [Pseudomonas aeruginosa]|uniref:hypothetical protein n=1 Tax=Pseudomonas aeruginosa TaxID=287 RepID=UPI003D9C3E9B